MSDFNVLSDENSERLRQYFLNDESAGMVLSFISKMRRYELVPVKNDNTICVIVPTVADGTGLDERCIQRVFRELEDLKCGWYRESRRGFDARLELNVDLTSEVKKFSLRNVIDDSDERDVRPLLKQPPVQQMRSVQQSAPVQHQRIAQPMRAVPTLSNHMFHLRVDLDIEIKLPKDLTMNEAERVSMFIKSQVLL